MALDETHDPKRKSWVEAANVPGADFPLQNLPFCVFRRKGVPEAARGGVAIGDRIVDLAACHRAAIFSGAAAAAAAAASGATLNPLMALGPGPANALRLELSRMLGTEKSAKRASVEPHLVAMQDAELLLPAEIGDFSDFFSSIHHATNAGRAFRPDNPLMPNFKYVPVAYHSRASSVVPSGTNFRRPKGQTAPARRRRAVP